MLIADTQIKKQSAEFMCKMHVDSADFHSYGQLTFA